MRSLVLAGIVQLICKTINNNTGKDWIKKFREDNHLTFSHRLRQFSDEDKFLVNNHTVFIGTILKRPLNIINKIETTTGLISILENVTGLEMNSHYGVIIGADTNETLLIIEMTSGPHHIRITDLKGFLADNKFSLEEISIELEPAQTISRDTIIERAKRYECELYDLYDLNCIDFANYIKYEIEPTKKSGTIFDAKMFLLDYAICMVELDLTKTVNPDEIRLLQSSISDLKIERGMLNFEKNPPPQIIPL